MAFRFVSKLQNLWPFSAFKPDDLRSSNELVRNLPIPERTKQFVYAVQDPETRSTIYILSAQSLSESSSLDVKCLVREIKPEAVIAQLGVSHGIEVLAEEGELEENGKNPLPTSSVEVLRRSFVDKVSKERYEDLAGSLVLKEIFGVGFHGHLLEAKKAAKESGSSFLVIESPCLSSIAGDGDDDVASGESVVMNKFQRLVSSLIPRQAFGSAVSLSSRRFVLTSDVHLEMVKLLSPHVETAMALPRLALTSPIAHEGSSTEIGPEESYEAPLFARSIYPLLEDLHGMFGDIPSIGRALAHAQKMLFDVNRGESVDGKIMSGVYTFRVAVEGLRIALNNAGRLPIDKLGNPKTEKPEFSELSVQEKSQVLFAQALRAQTKNFKTTVAVVDASSLAGLRRYWNDPVPDEVEHLVRELCSGDEDRDGGDGETANQTNRKRLLTGKPVVAVGAGATAVLGVSSLSKTVQASTFMKLVTLKLPVSSLKLALAQTQKAMSLVLGKTLAPAKASTALKATASAEKIRAVAHGVIASAEKTSLSAMRTAFYEIMRKRRVRPIGALPWATFGCSVATCSGLLIYGDGIECAVESVPTAPMIASLGRGVQRLKEVSREVRHTDSARVHNSIESLMARLKKSKIQ